MDVLRTEEREVLTVPEVARYLGIGTTKAWELVKCGSIPSFRPGGRIVRVRKEELLAWIKAQEQKTKEDVYQRTIEEPFPSVKRRVSR